MSTTTTTPVKPNASYGSLICQALQSKGKMTVSEIYEWIRENYPYYNSEDGGWQSSIRYNLSHHKCFAQIPKNDPSQKGGLWYYVPLPNYQYEKGVLTKKRMPNEARFSASQDLSAADELAGEAGPSSSGKTGGEAEHTEKLGAIEITTPHRKRKATDEATPKPKEHRVDSDLRDANDAGEAGAEADVEKRLSTTTMEPDEEIDLEQQLDQAMKGIQADDKTLEGLVGAAEAEADKLAAKASPSSETKKSERFSFAKIIATAIAQSPEKKMALSSLYAWFSEQYPQYCKNNAYSWKNSIRHNLSYYPLFVKLPRGDQDGGKGSYWGISDTASEFPSPGRARRPKYMKDLMKVKEEGSSSSQPPQPQGEADLGDPTQAPREHGAAEEHDPERDMGDQQKGLEGAGPSSIQAAEEEGAKEVSSASRAHHTLQPMDEDPIPKEVLGEPTATSKKESTPAGPKNELANDAAHPLPSVSNGGGPESVRPVHMDQQKDSKSAEEVAEGEDLDSFPMPQEDQDQDQDHQDHQENQDYLVNEKVRPPFSYSFLIGHAITAQPHHRATLSEIIEWLMQTYPYFRVHNNSWHNSIRNILSVKPFFIKVPRGDSESGKGSYWTIAPSARESFDKGAHFKAGKLNLKYKKDPALDMKDEVDTKEVQEEERSREDEEDEVRLPAKKTSPGSLPAEAEPNVGEVSMPPGLSISLEKMDESDAHLPAPAIEIIPTLSSVVENTEIPEPPQHESAEEKPKKAGTHEFEVTLDELGA